MHGGAKPRVGSAAAHMARQRFVDLAIGWCRMVAEERRGLHDHAWLAEAALRDILFNPRALAGMCAVRREPLNGNVGLPRHGGERDHAGSDGAPVLVNRARAAEADAAAVLGAEQAKPVAQRPEQWHVGITLDLLHMSVDREIEQRHAGLDDKTSIAVLLPDGSGHTLHHITAVGGDALPPDYAAYWMSTFLSHHTGRASHLWDSDPS